MTPEIGDPGFGVLRNRGTPILGYPGFNTFGQTLETLKPRIGAFHGYSSILVYTGIMGYTGYVMNQVPRIMGCRDVGVDMPNRDIANHDTPKHDTPKMETP